MSGVRTPSTSTAKSRLIRDFLMQACVISGAFVVLLALLTIFLYLLYVVIPVFEPAEVNYSHRFQIENADDSLYLGVDDKGDIAYRVRQKHIDFYSLNPEDNGFLLKSIGLTFSGENPHFVASEPMLDLLGYGFESGELHILSPNYRIEYYDSQKFVSPTVAYPFSNKALYTLPNGKVLRELAITTFNDFIGTAALTRSGELWLSVFSKSGARISQQLIVDSLHIESLSKIFITPDFSRALVIGDDRLHVYDLRALNNNPLLGAFELKQFEGQVLTSFAFLSSGSSLLVGDSLGQIHQWFEINDGGRAWRNIRSFKLNDAPITALTTEHYRKGFFASDADGKTGLFFTTSDIKLWHSEVAAENIHHVAMAPRANRIVIQRNNGELEIFDVDNQHPEITWTALWNKIWYENYSHPEYIWQSSAATDEFESKLSLVPLSFGTIKAALFALLFSVPIGLGAAIYTAYFMQPKLRGIVKPTIELMEALPTVILGFLAGLWLAPLLEKHLFAVMLLVVLLPLTILLLAYFTPKLIACSRYRLLEGAEPFILMIGIALIFYVCFSVDVTFERLLFDGSFKDHLTNEWGIDFNQRNAIVIGIAMGFAVIPTIFSITEDAVFSVPNHLSHGSLALGATQWQTLTKVVLLTASPGIFSAVMMGLGRAFGETMIVLMATGNTPILDWNMFEGMRTLAANIAIEMPESEVGSSHYRVLFLAALVLFVFTFLFNTVAEFVRQRLRERYRML